MTKEEYQELKNFYQRKISSTKGDCSNKSQGYSEGLNSFMSKARELYQKSQMRENNIHAIDKEEYQELKNFYQRKISSTKGDCSNKAQGYSEGLNSFMSKTRELFQKSQMQENNIHAIDKAVDKVMENQIHQEEIMEVETWEMQM
ncbi:MAG: hypothetical protein ACI4F4_06580 [Lachnospiraceae bacterium]